MPGKGAGCRTVCPAQLIGREELASLDMGSTADVAILKLVEKEVCYSDRNGHTFTGRSGHCSANDHKRRQGNVLPG